MVILIKRDFSGGRADAVNSGDLRLQPKIIMGLSDYG
jgi:hypothetical protein